MRRNHRAVEALHMQAAVLAASDKLVLVLRPALAERADGERVGAAMGEGGGPAASVSVSGSIISGSKMSEPFQYSRSAISTRSGRRPSSRRATESATCPLMAAAFVGTEARGIV